MPWPGSRLRGVDRREGSALVDEAVEGAAGIDVAADHCPAVVDPEGQGPLLAPAPGQRMVDRAGASAGRPDPAVRGTVGIGVGADNHAGVVERSYSRDSRRARVIEPDQLAAVLDVAKGTVVLVKVRPSQNAMVVDAVDPSAARRAGNVHCLEVY